MHFYKLGYWSHDGSAGVELCHPDPIDATAFESLVHQGVAALLRKERKAHAHFPFAWLYDGVAIWLCEHHGFSRVAYTTEFEIYGSGSVLAGDPDMPDLQRLYAYLKGEGLAP